MSRVKTCFSVVLLIFGTAVGQNLPSSGQRSQSGAGWDLAAWRAFPFDYQELSTREAPLWTGENKDWVRMGDSWVAAKKTDTETEKKTAPAVNGTLKITEFYVSGGGNESGTNRIYCARAVPKEGKGPFPVLFVFHGGGGHASGALALTIARNNPGFAAVAVDYNGQYSPSSTPVTKWVTLTAKLRERRLDLVPNPYHFPLYHNVQAARRVLDWVDEQPWADTNKFGAIGISYGGWVSFFLGGVDHRIKGIVTMVSAAGTRGLHSRAAQPLFWDPADQRELWLQYADPIAYAAQTHVPVFMKLAANDRFFWLSGAAKHRAALGGQAAWLLTPNCDHNNGGPDQPDPSALWEQYVFNGGLPFPSFQSPGFSTDGLRAEVRIESKRPIQSVHLAWSVGNDVPPARYWHWIEAAEKNGVWSAPLPKGQEIFAGLAYFTVYDVDGRGVSSDLIEKPGIALAQALQSNDGSLWDTASGADAWRSDLSFASVAFQTEPKDRVKVTPSKANSRVAVLSNSVNLPAGEAGKHRGIRIELGGNGTAFPIEVILARDYLALNEQKFSTTVNVVAGVQTFELEWSRFGKADRDILPVNGLVLKMDKMPADGLTVGPVQWLN
jgi:dienelactone hydrolase